MTMSAQYHDNNTIKIVRRITISITEDAPITANNLPCVNVLKRGVAFLDDFSKTTRRPVANVIFTICSQAA